MTAMKNNSSSGAEIRNGELFDSVELPAPLVEEEKNNSSRVCEFKIDQQAQHGLVL